MVMTATRAVTSAEAPSAMASCEPGLKPYQPTQRMKVPSTTSAALCPGMGTALPSGPKRPVRGPTMMAPISPATPPVMCTTPEPAKSITACLFSSPQADNQPLPSHTQCTTTG